MNVLEALLGARTVILQDCGFWREQWPDHELWTRFPALSMPEARDYQSEVMQLHNAAISDLSHVPRNSYDQVMTLSICTKQRRVKFAHVHCMLAVESEQLPYPTSAAVRCRL